MRFDLATASDDQALRRLLRENPMDGTVRVTLEREPNAFLAATIEGDVHQTVAAWADEDSRLIGIGSRAVMTAYVNGEPQSIGYLGQLRIDQSHPARRRLFRGGYGKIKDLHADGATAFYITTIVEENRPARRMLEAGLPGLPIYRALDELVTLVIPVTRRVRLRADRVERASPDQAAAIIDCLQRNGRRHQFARHWTHEDLCSDERTRELRLDDFFVRVEDGGVVGCVALWNQAAFKQTVVQGYAPWLARARPLVNVLGPVIRQPHLPAPGGMLKSAFASHLAFDDDDLDTALSLLGHVCSEARGRHLDYVVVGFSRLHPLLPQVKRTFTHREYVSILYQVYWEEDIDLLPTLDGRVPHVEVATI